MESGILKKIIETTIQNFIIKNFPHILVPQMVFARVTKGGETQIDIKILDNNDNFDENYEEIPEIKVDKPCQACTSCDKYKPYKDGDKIIVSFIHGELEKPIVLRRYNQ